MGSALPVRLRPTPTNNTMNKLRFIHHPEEGHTEIRAKLLSTGRYATFGYCHPASVPLIRKDGIKPHVHLVRLAPVK